jgi:hypothetical protein
MKLNLLVLLVALFFQGCRKGDQPSRLAGKQLFKQLKGSWKIDEYTIHSSYSIDESIYIITTSTDIDLKDNMLYKWTHVNISDQDTISTTTSTLDSSLMDLRITFTDYQYLDSRISYSYTKYTKDFISGQEFFGRATYNISWESSTHILIDGYPADIAALNDKVYLSYFDERESPSVIGKPSVTSVRMVLTRVND